MKVIHIVGWKNHGKTTLMVELIREITGRGISVGVIKHCGHPHELDRPGTDSFLHRHAGAGVVAAITPGISAVFTTEDMAVDAYAALRPAFAQYDLVLIEGDKDGPGPKVEVWRAAMGSPPAANERDDILGIITDDPLDTSLPVWPRADIAALTDMVLEKAGEI